MITLVGIPEIETDRLRLRGPKTSDFDAMAAFLGSPRSAFVGGPVSSGQAWRSFCHLTGHWLHRGYSMFILADKSTDAALGMAGPWFPEGWPEPELGWSIWDADSEGHGLAHEAAVAARAHAYDALGWKTAISLIADDNLRSQALARRLGCTRDGSFSHETFGASQIWRHPAPEYLQ
ncbi:GNAT family acetyltransferase [Cypionkella aquatica]|uniref:GNAT family acetyltransferase n=1 Tax=Cypionkella aquatica TaxID=1756042 RepID=A0AA37TQF5_9RHOB|nr:GNAT family N-acetyltransferase [Cypionkella aquatica]GLS85762.1 GNAT family acetyltransferase [Cypionkella aquatica]